VQSRWLTAVPTAANRLPPASSRSLAEHRARAPSARSRAGPAAVPERAAQWSFASGAVRPDGLRGLARSSFDLAAAVARRRAACLPAVLPLLPELVLFRRSGSMRASARRRRVSCRLRCCACKLRRRRQLREVGPHRRTPRRFPRRGR
jgi:hypothetical protein